MFPVESNNPGEPTTLYSGLNVQLVTLSLCLDPQCPTNFTSMCFWWHKRRRHKIESDPIQIEHLVHRMCYTIYYTHRQQLRTIKNKLIHIRITQQAHIQIHKIDVYRIDIKGT